MLKQQIEQQASKALKEGNRDLLDTLRFLISEIKNTEIDLKREPTDEEVLSVIQHQVKQHRESVEAYSKAGRTDLQTREQTQLEILQKYLPEQMSEEDLKNQLNQIIAELPAEEKNIGKIMGLVMSRFKGKADGAVISRLIKEIIGQ